MLKLICQVGVKLGQEFEISSSSYTIGRKTGNDLQITSPYVSKYHAEIFYDDQGQYWVKDLGSTNGTFLDKKPISGAAPIREGSQLIFGRSDAFKVGLVTNVSEELLQFQINESLGGTFSRAALNETSSSPPKVTTPVMPKNAANISDAWLNLMSLSQEFKQDMNFSERKSETESFKISKLQWPDVIQINRENEVYKDMFAVARFLLKATDRFQICEEAQQIMSPVIPFHAGLIVLHKDPDRLESWEKHYLNRTDYDLLEHATELHQSKIGQFETQLLPYNIRKNSLLYSRLREGEKTFGFVVIIAPIEEEGFSESGKKDFQMICQLMEAALIKFWTV